MKKLLLFWRLLCAIAMLAPFALRADTQPLRLLVIGNSFSQNATHFLPAMATSGGHRLIIARAQKGGCSLEQHWNALAAALANTNDARGKIYDGKSLLQVMGGTNWDLITVQQFSWLSGDPATYLPFATNLVRELQKLQPAAKIFVHETWPYRCDATEFGLIGPNRHAQTQREMWQAVHEANRQLAAVLHAEIIPTGDAFWQIASDPKWSFKPDPAFDTKAAHPPILPDQHASLNLGYYWQKETLVFDSHHANAAGEYLGALVWYASVFKESPERLKFIPENVDPEFAAHLRKVAWEVVTRNSTNGLAPQ